MREIKKLPLSEQLKILKKEDIPYWLPDESVAEKRILPSAIKEATPYQISPA